MDFDVSFVFDGIENLEECDNVVASLLVKYHLKDGGKVWSLYYQPTVTDAKYLLASYYDEIIH